MVGNVQQIKLRDWNTKEGWARGGGEITFPPFLVSLVIIIIISIWDTWVGECSAHPHIIWEFNAPD